MTRSSLDADVTKLGMIAAGLAPARDRSLGARRFARAFAMFFKRSIGGYQVSDTQRAVVNVLEGVLNLQGRSRGFEPSTPLLGAIPELDSMAVVSVITALEEKFAFVVDDDEIDGSTFATVGTLVGFVERKLRA